MVDIELEGVGPVEACALVLPSDAAAGVPRARVIWLLLHRADGMVVDPNCHEEELIALEPSAVRKAAL